MIGTFFKSQNLNCQELFTEMNYTQSYYNGFSIIEDDIEINSIDGIEFDGLIKKRINNLGQHGIKIFSGTQWKFITPNLNYKDWNDLYLNYFTLEKNLQEINIKKVYEIVEMNGTVTEWEEDILNKNFEFTHTFNDTIEIKSFNIYIKYFIPIKVKWEHNIQFFNVGEKINLYNILQTNDKISDKYIKISTNIIDYKTKTENLECFLETCLNYRRNIQIDYKLLESGGYGVSEYGVSEYGVSENSTPKYIDALIEDYSVENINNCNNINLSLILDLSQFLRYYSV